MSAMEGGLTNEEVLSRHVAWESYKTSGQISDNDYKLIKRLDKNTDTAKVSAMESVRAPHSSALHLDVTVGAYCVERTVRDAAWRGVGCILRSSMLPVQTRALTGAVSIDAPAAPTTCRSG